MRIEHLEPRQYLSATFGLHAWTAPQQLGKVAPTGEASSTLAAAKTLRQQLVERISDPTITASLSRTLRYSGADAFDASLLKYMIRRDGPAYYFTGKQFTRALGDFPDLRQSSDIAQAIARADSVLAHRFPEQLSATSFKVQLPPGTIDWLDQPAGTTNPNFLDGINRQAFWKDLGIAYRATGDGKYVRELVAQLQSWSKQAPVPANPDDWANSGPTWLLLTAADRASNWVYAYAMVLGSADWSAAANTLFLSKLWEHGDFLSKVTSSGYGKNRTALQGAAVWQLGILFPEFAGAAAWETRGADITFRCLEAQFFADGGQIEETPFYAVSVLDSMLQSYRLAQKYGRPGWTKHRREMLTNGIEALYQVLTPDGRLPSVSDTYRSSEVGRFFTRAAITFQDWRYHISGSIYLDDVIAANGDLNKVILGTGNLFARPLTYALPDSGYYVIRGRGLSAIFDAGPKGGAHGHYDLLSFELNGNPVPIPDPGPYTYDDSPQRAYAISTPAHNTISIDGKNHDAVEGAHNRMIAVDEFTQGVNEARVTAHHYAYQSLAGRPVVGRTFWADQTASNPRPVTITVDWGRSDILAPHAFTSSMNIGSTTVTQVAAGVYDASLTKFVKMRVQSLLLPGQSVAVTDTEVTDAPPPGGQTAAKRYSVSQTGTSYLSVTMTSQYIPVDSEQPASVAFEATPKKGQPLRLALTMPDGTVRHLVFPAPDLSPLGAAKAAAMNAATPANAIAAESPASAVPPFTNAITRACPFFAGRVHNTNDLWDAL